MRSGVDSPAAAEQAAGVAPVDDRRVNSGIFYILGTGAPWRDLPGRFGPRTAIYNRCNRRARAGVWLPILEALAEKSPRSLHVIGSSIARAHQHAAGEKGGADHAIGLSRGGLTPKIHAVVDGGGPPVRLLLTPGQASDKTTAPPRTS